MLYSVLICIVCYRPYLDSIKKHCVESCSRDRCMNAVKDFYR